MKEISPPFFVRYIQTELERRKRINPRYSLRAFSRFLETDPAVLSRLLRGKQPLSLREAVKFLKKFAPLSVGTQRLFLESVIQDHSDRLRASLTFDPEAAELLKESTQPDLRFDTQFPAHREAWQPIQEIAQSTTERMADWVSLHLKYPDGRVCRLFALHSSPQVLQEYLALEHRFPPNPGAPHGFARVLRTGVPEFLSHIPDAMIEDDFKNVRYDQECLRFYVNHRLSSQISVPIHDGDRVCGALTLSYAESERHYQTSDFLAAEKLASETSIALRTHGLRLE